MAIAARHSARRPYQANSHVYKAVHIISKRLDRKPLKLTDGLLGAVFTLSYSEVRDKLTVNFILFLTECSYL